MTNAELAVLGLIVEQPRHGYQIEQVIEERGMRNWTEIGFSSIYYLLKKLEKSGYVTARVEYAQGKTRRIYHTTPAGIQAYQDAVLAALSTPRGGYPSIYMGLSGLPVVSTAEAADAMRQYRAALESRNTEMQAARERQEPLPFFVSAIFDHTTQVAAAEMAWLDGFIHKLEEMTMEKVDFKKELKHLYQPSAKKVEQVDVPEMNFLMVDGSGNPNTSQVYQDAVEALYGMAYTLKFMSKQKLEKDYTVPPLEGLWWAKDMDVFLDGDKDQWEWTMMIMVPEWITPEMIETAKAELKAKKDPTALDQLYVQKYHEGLAAHITHIGPYAAEAPTVEKLHNFIAGQGYLLSGKHHEIYLGDPRRTAPEKLRTVIRQPMRKA